MIHYVYILKCNDGEYYTGITSSIKKRLIAHTNGECHSTAYRLPVTCIWYCACSSKQQAARLEKYLKSHLGRLFRNRFLI